MLGRALVFIGLVIVVIGVGLMFAERVPFLGRLPGDIAVQRGNFGFYFPIMTCIIASIVLTVLLNIAGRLFR